jgi:hypothetical protein
MIGLCHKCLKSNVEVDKNIICNDCVKNTG